MSIRNILKRMLMSMAVTAGSLLITKATVFADHLPAFSVTVPSSLPVSVAADGTVTTANNIVITNAGVHDAKISLVSVTGANGWAYDGSDVAGTDYSATKVNTNRFAMAVTVPSTRIIPGNSITLTYSAKLPARSANMAGAQIANVVVQATDMGSSGPVLNCSSSSSSGATNWYKGSVARSTITEIHFLPTNSTAGGRPSTYDEVWNGDVNNAGSIKCYRVGTVVYICSGSGRLMQIKSNGLFYKNGASADDRYSSLTTVTGLEYTETSNLTDMQRFFSNLQAIETIDLSYWDLSNVTVMYSCFSGCSALKTFVPPSETVHLSSSTFACGYMFYYCKAIETIDVAWLDTTNATSFLCMFAYCNNLKTLNVNNFNTSSVTSFTSMFSNCGELTSLNIGNFNFSACTGATGLTAMFNGCSKLSSLNANFNATQCTSLQNMFRNCALLQSVDISKLSTASVTNTTYMFDGCAQMRYIYAGTGWSTAAVTSSAYMFRNCSMLPNYNASYVDKTRAHYNSGGYLTYKAAKSMSLNTNKNVVTNYSLE